MPGFNSQMNAPYSKEQSSVSWPKVAAYGAGGLAAYGVARAGYTKGKGPFAKITGIQQGSWGQHQEAGSKILSSMKPHSKKALKQARKQVLSSGFDVAGDATGAGAYRASGANYETWEKSMKGHRKTANAALEAHDQAAIRRDTKMASWMESNPNAKKKDIKAQRDAYSAAESVEKGGIHQQNVKASRSHLKAQQKVFNPMKKGYQEALEKVLPEKNGFQAAMKKDGWRGQLASHAAGATGWLGASDYATAAGGPGGMKRLGVGALRGGLALGAVGLGMKALSWANPFSDR